VNDELERLRSLLKRCVPALELANSMARVAGIDPAPGVNLLAEVKMSCLPLVGVETLDDAAEG